MSEKESLLNTLLGLSMIVEARDPYTGGHLWRVSQFSKLLAQEAGLSKRDIALCEIGGFLHDLGKVGVPDAILNKADRLTDGEYDIIKTHPAVGGKLLSNHPLARLAFDAVTGHHERPDGKGYPHGLAGDVIPEVARIVSIADAFDAMTSTRAYQSDDPISLPHAQGCIFGALIGDAAGATLEFIGHKPDADEVETALRMVGGGVWGVAPGQITDDGELTLSLAQALSAGSPYDPVKVASQYRLWHMSAPFDVGNATNAAMSQGNPGNPDLADVFLANAARFNMASKANGSVMRATPLGVWGASVSLKEAIDAARLDARLSHPNPVVQVNTKAWRKALAKVGIEDFRWHDLRHTWASWHVQAGTPLHVLQELGGWECVEMVRKYAHLSSEHLTEYVDRLSRLKAVESEPGELATIGLR